MTVGPVDADRRVTIVDPQASWPADFESISDSVRQELGELALRVDHIGSTLVPGLPAKDVIDVQVTVTSLDRDRLVPALARAGFVDRAIGNDHALPARRARMPIGRSCSFSHGSGDQPTFTFASRGRPSQRYTLRFRDYLRAHPEAAAS